MASKSGKIYPTTGHKSPSSGAVLRLRNTACRGNSVSRGRSGAYGWSAYNRQPRCT